jgi:pimeloyl-ACP methyl ester carboxylesterase
MGWPVEGENMVRRSLLLVLVVGLGTLSAEPPKPGLNSKLPVTKETRIDWTFAVANQSVTNPPAKWLGDYDSTKTTFDLFVPAVKDSKQPLGLVLYVPADNGAGGFSPLIEACKGLGFACAAVRDAGNNVMPQQRRYRMVLDVLDEVRSLLPVDADRTYIAGFSGGGRVASRIANGLPELFGGLLAIGASEELREEPYLRQRCIDRLSVAIVVGEKDFNRGEGERFKGPILKELGVRTQVTVVPGQGHGVPDAKTLTGVLKWLDDGVKQRRDLAKEYPASRISASPARAELAQALLDEGKKRLEKPATQTSGLMQLKGVLERWPDLKQAAAAKDILEAYDGKKDRPWEDEDIAARRKYLAARARGLTAYATGDLPKEYSEQRPDMAKAAIEMWEALIDDGKDVKAVAEGKKRLPELKKLAEK